ncbi:MULTISPECIES: ADP-ribosyltransferase [Psychrobacillus]|uniref:ADP-ribosyltransferase n=1 Tax=Psychrobacillus TaxID=1221880 RepID=UPI0030FB4848
MSFFSRKHNLISFKNFNEEDEAEQWANQNYKNTEVNNEVMKTIATYCKEDTPTLNLVLRNETEATEINSGEIKSLDQFLQGHRVNENIIVYRTINFNPFKKKRKFIEKGYMSTSLLNNSPAHVFNYKYRLKIYVPKGTNGFYVNFISCRPGEFEFLLKRNTTLHFIKESKIENLNLIECYIK